MNTATTTDCTITPGTSYRLWLASLVDHAVRLGATADGIRAAIESGAAKPSIWFNAGEAAWSAAEQMAAYARSKQ